MYLLLIIISLIVAITTRTIMSESSTIDLKKTFPEVYKEDQSLCNKYKNYEMYWIEDNGSNNYRVFRKKNHIVVTGRPQKVRKYINDNFEPPFPDYDNLEKMYTQTIKEFKAEKVFIGESPKTEYSLYAGGGHNPHLGNTILLHLSSHKYVFIGKNQIIQFNSPIVIKTYISLLLDNWVPYPIASDNEGNYILFTERHPHFIRNKDLTMENPDAIIDYFYDIYRKSSKNVPALSNISKYRTRNSPPISASKFPKDIAIGNDGKLWTSVKSGKTFVWKSGGTKATIQWYEPAIELRDTLLHTSR